MKRLLIFLLFPLMLAGQGTQISQTIVARLPSPPSHANTIFYVTDGANSTDCTIGGGTIGVLCVWNGTTWGAAGSSSTGNFLPGCNVTQTTCLGTTTTAAVADWKQITDGTCTNSSSNISWGTANEITSADVGKVIDITENTNAWHNTSKTTIATVTSSTTGTISQAVTGSGCGSGNMIFDVYTDNGAAFNSVELAIHNSTVHKGIIWYPCGVYGVAVPYWNQSGVNDSISYWGGGGGHAASTVGQCTVFKNSPAIFASVSGTGLSALTPANGDERDIVLDGENIITAATNANFINWNGVTHVFNIQFVAWLATNGNNPGLCHVNSDNFSSENLSCNFKDGRGMAVNTLNSVFLNPQFSGNPGLELADTYATFVGGIIGTNASVAASAVTSISGSGAVMATFNGSRFLGTPTSGGILNITKPSGNPVQVNLNGVTIDCGNTNNVAMMTIGSGAIVQMEGLGNANALSTTGCPGTPIITNNGIFRDGGANGWGATGMTLSWAGSGTFTMDCNSWWVAPTISSGFGTTPSIASGKSPCTFTVNVGGGGVATSGVVSFTQAAPTGWNCTAIDQTTNTVTRQTANNTTTVTLTAAAAWGANDILSLHCDPF